jgi:uncharacterized Zn-binding protein involved in type VI secretion
MKSIILLGDATSHGGCVITASSFMSVGGKVAALRGDTVSCPLHGNNEIVEGDDTLTSGGEPMAVDGCRTACGAVLIASTDTLLGDGR